MLGFIIGDMIVGSLGYFWYLAGYALAIGVLLAIPYLILSRLYFLLAGIFNFLACGLFTLDNVCDVFIKVLTVPVDILTWVLSHLWNIIAMISMYH